MFISPVVDDEHATCISNRWDGHGFDRLPRGPSSHEDESQQAEQRRFRYQVPQQKTARVISWASYRHLQGLLSRGSLARSSKAIARKHFRTTPRSDKVYQAQALRHC